MIVDEFEAYLDGMLSASDLRFGTRSLLAKENGWADKKAWLLL